ncbi:MAG: F0F1 ATP synthase subunit A [Dehalococcoidia bacterium]|nr:F0F1 ATP synthase subunit A [Dehalococcoidia bacterium]
MAKKAGCGLSLNLLVIIILAGLALVVISFVGGTVGAMIFGGEPMSIFAVHAPAPELPAEHPFAGIPITNTMITAWVSILALTGLFFAGTRKMKVVPGGLQSVVEFIFEVASNFIEDAAGKEKARWFFPVVVTIFLFVVTNAWFSLVPGMESIHLDGAPLFRNANTDINVPLALALVSFIAVEYWGFKAKGGAYIKTFLNFGALGNALVKLFTGKIKAGLSGLFSGFVAAFVGILEILSHLIRILSFTFRLFGNMTAGAILTMIMIFIVPWVIPSIFYGLEAFFGFVQAMIFGGLTLGFACAAVMPEE